MNIKPDTNLTSTFQTVMAFKRDARNRILEQATDEGRLIDDTDLDQTTIIDGSLDSDDSDDSDEEKE